MLKNASICFRTSLEGSRRPQKSTKNSTFCRHFFVTVDLLSLRFRADFWASRELKCRPHDGKGGDDKIVTIA